MNATNRGVNRIVLLVAGIVLLAVGGAAIAATAWPPAGEIWRSRTAAATQWLHEADDLTRLSEATTVSWLIVGLLAVLLLAVVLAIVVIARLGGGRSSTVIREDAGEGAQGAVTIRQGFASDALTHSLTGRDEILASRVRARRVHGTDVLHVSITPRQNASPLDVAAMVTPLVDNLAALTGRQTPTFISIHSGVRARLAADQPRVR